MNRSIHLLLGAVLLASTVAQASLFSFSDESRAAKRARAADRAMERAENAMDDKDFEKAKKLFAEAIEYYQKTEEAVPGYMDNLPAIRIRYCSEQLTNAVLAIEAAVVQADSAPSADADEAAEKAAEADAEEAGGKAAPETAIAKAPKPAETPASAPAPIEGESAAEAFARATGEPQPESLPGASAEKHGAEESVVAEAEPIAKSPARKPAEAAPAKRSLAEATAAAVASARAASAAESAEKAVEAVPVAPEEEGHSDYDPRNFVHDYNEARDLLESGKTAEAASLVIPLLRYDPGNRSVRILLALIRTQQGRCDEAIVALENLRGRRDDLPLLLALSAAYTGAGRYHDSLLALDSAMRLAPSDPAAYLNSAWLTLIMPSSGPNTLKHAEAYYRMAIARGAARDRALERRLGLAKW